MDMIVVYWLIVAWMTFAMAFGGGLYLINATSLPVWLISFLYAPAVIALYVAMYHMFT